VWPLHLRFYVTFKDFTSHSKILRHIRQLVIVQTANIIGYKHAAPQGLALDYCNSLLAGASAHNIARLQRAQNNAHNDAQNDAQNNEIKIVCWNYMLLAI